MENRFSVAAGLARTTPGIFDYGLFAVVVLTLGISWIAVHYQVGSIAPEISVIWRFVIAVPVTLLIAICRRERLVFSPRQHAYIALFGGTFFCAYFLVSIYAAALISSGLIAVVMSLVSILNAGLGVLFLNLPLDRRVLGGGALGAAGLACIFAPEILGGVGSNAIAGLGLSLLGMGFFSTGTIVSARMQREGVTILAANAIGMIYGGIGLGVFAIFRGIKFNIDWSTDYILSLLYLALMISVVTSLCFLNLVRRIGPARAAYALVVSPVVALIVSSVYEGYAVTPFSAFGTALIVFGNIIVLRPG